MSSPAILSKSYNFITRTFSKLLSSVVFRGTTDWCWRKHLKTISVNLDGATRGLIWFHAASAGELEMLWSVARELRNQSDLGSYDFGLTVFSPSGRTRLERFQQEFSTIYCGPAPWEGDWSSFFELIEKEKRRAPAIFITAKYECWPELWGALRSRSIPLVMINAEWRSSLRWGSRITRWIFGKIPEAIFFAVSSVAASELEHFLPNAKTRAAGDPRWDQMLDRLKKPHPRVQELKAIGERSGLPHPWIVVGSAWEEDLKILLDASSGSRFSGTLWFVPHRPSHEQLRIWARAVQSKFPNRVWKTRTADSICTDHSDEVPTIPVLGHFLKDAASASDSAGLPQVVLVQEMGILAELYSIGDAAWVGGGFRTGIHSVIEPALSDLWVASGSIRAASFPEVLDLHQQGQLSLIRSKGEASDWLQKIGQRPPQSLVQEWRQWRENAHLGAARRIAFELAEIVSRRGGV